MQQDKKLNLFRIIQEAVNNAVAHSQCISIKIFITKKDVLISDNGEGFDYQKNLIEKPNHYGLRSMKDRSQMIGSTFEVKSNCTGTTVQLSLGKR